MVGATRGERQPTLLRELLRQRHWQTYRRFSKEYDKAALQLDKDLVGTCPSDATFRRWLSGRIIGLPRAEPCVVLEAMLPGYSIQQLFEPFLDSDSYGVRADDDNSLPGQPVDAGGQSASQAQNQGILVSTAPGAAGTKPCATNGAPGEVEDVNRKEFLAGLLATIAAPSLLLADARPARVGAADVARYRHNLAQLYALDDHYGASGEIYSLTVRSMRHLLRVLETSSYSPAVGDELRSITGGLMENAGWLAFDADQQHDARYWWLEALHTARMADDTGVEVVVLTSMSLAASQQGRGQEAVSLAQAAARIVRRERPSPRLDSLLAAREALGHAHNGDAAAMSRSLERAHAQLNRGPHDNDPAWLEFWGPSDLANHASRAATRLGELGIAERSAREALTAVDAARYPRNQALYQAKLAAVLVAQNNIDEGVPLLAHAALQARDITSGRLTTEVQAAVHELRSRHGDAQAVRELAEWTDNALPRRTAWPTAS